MKVFDSPSNERARRLAGQISKNGSSMDMVRNYIEKIRNSVPGSPVISTIGRPTVNPVQLKSQPPVNPDLAPELYNMVPLMYDVPLVTSPYGVDEQVQTENLFSDEAKARRRIKQAYTESRFRKNAQSGAGARGLFQIMPITEQDYLGRGRGKAGDIWNEGYNGGIRDWVMTVIPKDLKEFWNDNDSDINKLAKLYAAYNWGAGNLRKFFQKRVDAGLSNDDPYEWVEAIQNKGKRKDETKNYVKFLALNQDIPDSYMTTEKFENAAKANGYMAEGGRLYGDGGDKKAKKLTKLISKLAEKKTNGLISSNDVETILAHPTDYMKHLYSEEELDDMRRRLYSEYYPMGYFNREGIPAASDIMQGKESKGEAKIYRNTMSGAISQNSNGSEKLRDSYFAQWLGIPDEDRRYPGLLIQSEYIPSIGTLSDLPVLSTADDAFPEKKQQIVDSYWAAKQLNDSKFTPDYLAIEKGSGDNYVVDPYIYLMKDNVPETRKEWRKWENDIKSSPYYNAKAPELFANGLAAFTVGSGIDPQRGQYISMFDKWDVNPFDHNGSFGDRATAKIAELAGIPQNFDATGGIGNPFYIYDRVYLDDYYGVNSKPENPDEYYGGYVMPSVVTANSEASGGKIHIKPENRGKFTALKKRTGHSASWFKAHGTPAQKKMATFAINSRKWRHGDGGPLDKYGDDAVREALSRLKANKFADGGEEKKKSFWNLPVRVPNMTGTATAAAISLRDIPKMDSTVGREAAVAGTALLSPISQRFVPHIFRVLSDPMKATTALGRVGSTFADAYGVASGLNSLSNDISRAASGDYGASDIPATVMNGMVMFPGSSLLADARTVGNMVDAGKVFAHIPQITSKETLVNRLMHPIETYRFSKISRDSKDIIPDDIYRQSLYNMSRSPFYNRPSGKSNYSIFNREPADQRMMYESIYDYAGNKGNDHGTFYALGDRTARTDFSRGHEFGHLVDDSARDLGYLTDNFPPAGYVYKGDPRPEVQQAEYFADVVGNALTRDAALETELDVINNRYPFLSGKTPAFIKVPNGHRSPSASLSGISPTMRKLYDTEMRNLKTAISDGDKAAETYFRGRVQKQIDNLRKLGVDVPDLDF